MSQEEIIDRVNVCPWRERILGGPYACTRYMGITVRCDGRCSWVGDYLRRKELDNKIDYKMDFKTYTDVEQSKKLAEILPLDSADMWWSERYSGRVTFGGYIVEETPYYYLSLTKPSEGNYSQDAVKDIPAWSIKALLDYIKGKCGYFELVYLSRTTDGRGNVWENVNRLSTDIYDVYEKEIIDACYEMVLKLNEKK